MTSENQDNGFPKNIFLVKYREVYLLIFTAVVVAFVRHGVDTQWGKWESTWQFFSYCFIHLIALAIFNALSVAAIVRFHKNILGYELERRSEEIVYYVLMTVLVGAISIFVLHFVGGNLDDYEY